MTKARITFHKCIQDSQDLGTAQISKAHMISRVFFILEIDDKKFEDMYVDVKQPFGTDFEKCPVEVFSPVGSYHGPMNHEQFSEAVEKYYRSIIGSQGSGIRIGSGAKNIRMRNNIIGKTEVTEIELSDQSNAW